MKFWVALAALTLLAAGCGAEPGAPTPAPSPAPSARIWGLLGALGEAAENATERLRRSALALRVQAVLQELRALHADLGARVAEYGAEAKAVLELGAADLRARGAAFARKFRKRLGRDHEELRRRWEGGMGRVRELWGRPQTHESPASGEETP
ncbi:apolipoprotein E-like [Ammospiza nelsoni]|uniref:apolipoprotein E-like n=1 Tax=Ammospiza nelsoni TaxID=2857394 RepID=UPI00286CCD6C|nr:apolipoprotein E-like [Ammospiza nelsoni]